MKTSILKLKKGTLKQPVPLSAFTNSQPEFYANTGIVTAQDGTFWRAFDVDFDEKYAREIFQLRFGREPAEVKRISAGYLLMGPLHIT